MMASEWLAERQAAGSEIVLLHGSSSARLASILRGGLRGVPGIGAARGQAAGVFCVAGAWRRYAQFWGVKAAECDRASGVAAAAAPVVVRFRVAAARVVPDSVNPRCFLVVLGDVAPGAIVGVDRPAMVDRVGMSMSDMSSYVEGVCNG